jgi:sugar lactone lactonase YvrE
VTYTGGVPTGATAQDLATSSDVGAPEGLVVLPAAGAYGAAGDLYVAEDKNPAKVIWIDPGSGAADSIASGFQRSEGLAFGDFAGAQPAALYTAETVANRVARIDSSGAVTTLGDPAAVGLSAPDNVEFGPDGFLYVGEDRTDHQGRILRVDPDGTHTVFATGFGSPQGMAFHPATGDLYISEQDYDRIWRVRFAAAPVAVPVASPITLVFGALAMLGAVLMERSMRPDGRAARSNCPAEVLRCARGDEADRERALR